MTTALSGKEAVGERFVLDTMRHAQQLTWKAVDEIAKVIKPGMRESGPRNKLVVRLNRPRDATCQP